MNGQPLKENDPAIPCGLVAKSVFNDTFELYDSKNQRVKIVETGIAWSSDIQYKFKNLEEKEIPKDLGAKSYKDVQWFDMQDEHFIVWMRTAGLPNFRKLWGKINDKLEPGEYTVKINNQFEVAPFQGRKFFVLSTTNALGGKNYFLAVCYIVVGTLCMLFAFIFCIAYMRKKNNSSS